jgi:hypothetical protein
MQHRERRVKVRIIKPDGKIAFTQDFATSAEAAARYARLVEACVKDLWFGATVQCLDADDKIVYEQVISNLSHYTTEKVYPKSRGRS